MAVIVPMKKKLINSIGESRDTQALVNSLETETVIKTGGLMIIWDRPPTEKAVAEAIAMLKVIGS